MNPYVVLLCAKKKPVTFDTMIYHIWWSKPSGFIDYYFVIWTIVKQLLVVNFE
jgi:hypothetical protein